MMSIFWIIIVGYDTLEAYGIVAPNTVQKHLCSFASVIGGVILIGGTILIGGFLVFEAESFEEIHDHFYEFVAGFNDSFYLVYIHCIYKQFFEMNDQFERMIEKRKFPLSLS